MPPKEQNSITVEVRNDECGKFYFTISRDKHGKIERIFQHSTKAGTCQTCLLGTLTYFLALLVSGKRPSPQDVLNRVKGQGCFGGESCISKLAHILEAEIDEPEKGDSGSPLTEVEDGGE